MYLLGKELCMCTRHPRHRERGEPALPTGVWRPPADAPQAGHAGDQRPVSVLRDIHASGRWGAVVLTLLLTACWSPLGKARSMEDWMGLATDTLIATGAVEQIACADTMRRGLESCFAVRGPVGVVSTPLHNAFRGKLHPLGDWQFVGGSGAMTYETRVGRSLQVGLVYSPDDEYRSFMEKLPEEADGILYVIVEAAPF